MARRRDGRVKQPFRTVKRRIVHHGGGGLPAAEGDARIGTQAHIVGMTANAEMNKSYISYVYVFVLIGIEEEGVGVTTVVGCKSLHIAAGSARIPSSLFEQLHSAHHGAVLGLAYVMSGQWCIAEEVTQEAFIKLLDARGKGQVDDPAGWVPTAAGSLARSRLRRLKAELRTMAGLLGRRQEHETGDATRLSTKPAWSVGRSLPKAAGRGGGAVLPGPSARKAGGRPDVRCRGDGQDASPSRSSRACRSTRPRPPQWGGLMPRTVTELHRRGQAAGQDVTASASICAQP